MAAICKLPDGRIAGFTSKWTGFVNTGRHFVTYRSVIPKNRQPRRPAAVPKGMRQNVDATALWNIESLENLSQIIPKGIAAANRMPLKTRVLIRTAGVFQKVWLMKQHLQGDQSGPGIRVFS
jgi:hypothetical protein